MAENIDPPIEPRFISVKQASKLYPAFSESSLRWWIQNKEANGASSFIKKIGKKKIIIEVSTFEKWLREGSKK